MPSKIDLARDGQARHDAGMDQDTSITTRAALDDLRAFVSPDPARTRLSAPWGCELEGRGYLCASDGHRLAAIRSNAWRAHAREDAPRMADHIPWGAQHFGALQLLEAMTLFPKSWGVSITLGQHFTRLTARVNRGRGKNARRVTVLDNVLTGWQLKLEYLTYHTSVNLPYLVDALKFVGSRDVHVFGAPLGTEDPDEHPLMFASMPLDLAPRFMLVMPRRT